MKKHFCFLLYFLLISNTLTSQEKDSSITTHPVIGDKPDRTENEYFKVFPMFDGFQEATFYLNPDSSLKVNINYETNDMLKDTSIEKYSRLMLIVEHIE